MKLFCVPLLVSSQDVEALFAGEGRSAADHERHEGGGGRDRERDARGVQPTEGRDPGQGVLVFWCFIL